MVKTRKGVKRPSPKGSKEEPPDSEEKKPKLEPCTKSKYFSQKNGSSSQLELNLDCEGVKRSESSESINSLFRNKSKSIKKIDEDSDSDGSSSDEFMKAPISLDDLGGFETLKKENKTPTKPTGIKNELDSTVSRLSDSDECKETNEQEFYDFSQIIKSQELIKVTKKEQEEKNKQDEENLKIETETFTSKKSKSKVTKSSNKRKKDTQPDLKALGEELGISELLAIAEGQHLVSKDDSESDVDNKEINTEENYSVPKEGVQITVELPNMVQLKKKKGFDVEAALKRRINLIRKENQVFMHKVHTLCWIAHGIYLNRSINNETLMGLALSLIPSNHCYPKKQMDLRYLEKLVEWFVGKITVVKHIFPNLNSSNSSLVNTLELQINSKKASSERDLVLIFVCVLRSLGINARLVINLRSVPIRPPITDLCSISNKPKEEDSKVSSKLSSPCKLSKVEPIDKVSSKKSTNPNRSKKAKCEVKTESEIKSPYFSSSDDLSLAELAQKKNSMIPTRASSNAMKKNTNISKNKKDTTSEDDKRSKSENFSKGKNEKSIINKQKQSRKLATDQELGSSSEDEVFQKRPESRKKPKGASKNSNSKTGNIKGRNKLKGQVLDSSEASTSKSIDRRVLSTDDEDSMSSNKIGNDYWAEVFVEEEEKWISVDLQKGRVHCINQLYKKATQPVRYVLAWNNDGSIKDVTRRYAPQWLTVTRRQRAEEEWWRETMAPYTPARTAREREEDEDLDRQLHDQPLPSSIADYKNHPLFALKRHLLKFQAIYPPDAPPLGFIKDEPVYSRGCVVELHTRETWIKEAKLVRRGEEPYKIVKARPKYDKLSGARLNDLPLPLFGFWQVEDYIPPPAVDGKVPRNEYGNVELYKPCMLPPGTVHLQVPGLARVARKLDIDCAPAVVGWEYSGGGSHPVLDGFIVCEEFRDILLDAWNKEIDESAKRAREKVEQRVYGNWKRLIKGLLIRERLKLRYDFGGTEKVPEKKKKQQSRPGTSKS